MTTSSCPWLGQDIASRSHALWPVLSPISSAARMEVSFQVTKAVRWLAVISNDWLHCFRISLLHTVSVSDPNMRKKVPEGLVLRLQYTTWGRGSLRVWYRDYSTRCEEEGPWGSGTETTVHDVRKRVPEDLIPRLQYTTWGRGSPRVWYRDYSTRREEEGPRGSGTETTVHNMRKRVPEGLIPRHSTQHITNVFFKVKLLPLVVVLCRNQRLFCLDQVATYSCTWSATLLNSPIKSGAHMRFVDM